MKYKEKGMKKEQKQVVINWIRAIIVMVLCLGIFSGGKINAQAEENPILALIYLTDYYDVRSEADGESDIVVQVESGQTVQILNVVVTDQEDVWCQVGLSKEDIYYEGYVERRYLACSDERLLQWEKDNMPEMQDEILRAGSFEDVESFPASYQEALRKLKEKHPNWTFVKMNTNLEWKTVIKNETGEASLVYHSSPDAWKNGLYGNGWFYATEDAIKYFMDPRNFLTEQYIFQFEQLTYNASYHTHDAVQQILKNTFMAGQLPGAEMTYSQAFYEIGANLKVSPFHLACRVVQEQGTGNSPLISGTYEGYEGLYNYYNIGASGYSEKMIVKNGLEKAREEGWTSPYLSLSGGAQSLSQGYILKGQDTLYLQKFDVDKSYFGLYWHQYMQNIQAPCSEGSNIRTAYSNVGALENPFVFKIPVYNNMPESACPRPEGEQEQEQEQPQEQPTEETKKWPFTDVMEEAGNWKYEGVKYVYEKGIMNGVKADLFQPDEPLTRAMFATVLYRMAGSPAVTYENKFSDVPAGKWYSNAVIWAYQQGIVSGLDGGTRFGTDENITREQITKMLKVYADKKGFDTSAVGDISGFADQDQVSKWAVDYVKWAVGSGMLNGKKINGVLHVAPLGEATRAECATMLMRFAQKYQGS